MRSDFILSFFSLLFLLSVVSALPTKEPVDQGPKFPQPQYEEPPLPGRSDISIDKNGVVTGHYGDDFLPEHMRHVQKNQQEYPQNAAAFPYNQNAKADRSKKLGGSRFRATEDPVTTFPRVMDEKPLASQKIKDNKGVTIQALSHKESGNAPANLVELAQYKEAKEKFEAANPGQTYAHPIQSAQNPDGSLRTELALTGKMRNAALENKHLGGQTAMTKITANPGWLPLKTKENSGKDAQLRAHEAPGRLGENYKPPTDQKAQDLKEKQEEHQSYYGAKGPPAQKFPENNGGKKDIATHPDYRPKDPQVSGSYKPGLASTLKISPPKEDPNHMPPRPQSRVSGPNTPSKPKYDPKPAPNPVKDDSSLGNDAYRGTHEKLPDGKKIQRVHPWDKPEPPKRKASTDGQASQAKKLKVDDVKTSPDHVANPKRKPTSELDPGTSKKTKSGTTGLPPRSKSVKGKGSASKKCRRDGAGCINHPKPSKQSVRKQPSSKTPKSLKTAKGKSRPLPGYPSAARKNQVYNSKSNTKHNSFKNSTPKHTNPQKNPSNRSNPQGTPKPTKSIKAGAGLGKKVGNQAQRNTTKGSKGVNVAKKLAPTTKKAGSNGKQAAPMVKKVGGEVKKAATAANKVGGGVGKAASTVRKGVGDAKEGASTASKLAKVGKDIKKAVPVVSKVAKIAKHLKREE